LAEAVVEATKKPNHFHYLYPLDMSIKEKIETIATKIYGAEGVDYARLAENMAKTHLSLSHEPLVKGRPRNFRIPVRDVRASVGAGFLYPLLGTMMTMPGLPSVPASTKVDIDEEGKTVGLF
jgi:formyltetrahydrofolate synthetase